MSRDDTLAKRVRIQALLVGLAAILGALYPFFTPTSAAGIALPVHPVAGVLSALVVVILAALVATFYPHHPTPGFWYTLSGLQIMAALALVFFTGGVESPAFLLLALLCAIIGLHHVPSSGLAAGTLAAVLISVAHLLGQDSQDGLAGVVLRSLALPAFGSLGILVTCSLSRGEAGGVTDQARRLEEAYATARQQAKERERREQDLYDKQRKLSALMQVSRHLSTVRTPEELLAVIVRSAREEMNSAISLVLLIEENELTVAQSHGISQLTAEALRTRVGTGLFGQVVVSGDVFRKAESRGDNLSEGLPGVRERFRTLLAVPLQTPQDRLPFGVLAVANILVGDSYEREHEDYLKILGTDAAISIKNIRLFAEVERSYYEIIQALAQAIEAKDPYTHGHVGRVRTGATRLARALNLSNEEVELIAKAAILHDVGKLSIPDQILMKDGPLSEDEFRVMKSHAENALHILKDIRSLPSRVIEMVLHHHERYDGRGYPHGLKGDEIPLGAQIIGVADTFDAMTSDRPYRKGFSPEEALARMESGMGTQFNPRILKAFFSLYNYRPGTRAPQVQGGAPHSEDPKSAGPVQKVIPFEAGAPGKKTLDLERRPADGTGGMALGVDGGRENP